MRKFLILILSFFFLLLYINKGKSQEITLKEVSVINDLGHVRLTWDYTGTDTLYIFRDELVVLNATEQIAVITNPATTSYIDYTAEAHKAPRAYRISENSLIRSDLVSTYHLTSDYDSCLQEINLNWTELIDPNLVLEWTPSQFYVNIIEDGDLRKINLDGTVNEYTIENLLENVYDTIFIEIQWQGQALTSASNPINLFTEMPIRPEYINAVSTVVDGSNTNIKFDIDPNTELDNYKLLKSNSKTGYFDTLETYTTTESQLITSDNNSRPQSEINFYKLISLNQCGVITDSSNVINNIVLEAENSDFDVSLSWNKFNENTIISEDYEIYRIVNSLDPELIGSFSNFNGFDDNIEHLQNYSQFCYYIQATETGTSKSNFSQSNIACVYLKPKVYFPEAFTPNGDGQNDYFQAIFSFVPKEFDFKVYNRWGNNVFETNDYLEAWDGKVSNGNYVPTGTYIYHIRIKSPNNQVVEQRGSILVIHP